MIKHWVIVLLAFAGLSMGACKDACRNQLCLNGSFCNNGECLCEKWYSGESCELKYNRNYAGTYYGDYTSENGRRTEGQDSVVFNADPIIPNRLNAEEGFYLEFDSDSTLVIPLQNVYQSSDSFSIKGTGHYQVNRMELNFEKQYTNAADGDVYISFIGDLVEKDNP